MEPINTGTPTFKINKNMHLVMGYNFFFFFPQILAKREL